MGGDMGQKSRTGPTKLLPTRPTNSGISGFDFFECPNVPKHMLRKPPSYAPLVSCATDLLSFGKLDNFPSRYWPHAAVLFWLWLYTSGTHKAPQNTRPGTFWAVVEEP